MSNLSEFKTVFSDKVWSDKFYRFLQVIFHLYPEDKFHHLINETTKTGGTDEEIYKKVSLGNKQTLNDFLGGSIDGEYCIRFQDRLVSAIYRP